MRAFVIGGADISDYSFCYDYLNSYIVCCDAGIRHAKNMGIVPNIIVGDFDSADKEDIEYFKKLNVKFKKYSPNKDETDMELGIDAALDAKCDEIVITGGIGSRIDHTMANMQLLYNIKKNNLNAVIVNEHNEIRLVCDNIVIKGKKGDIVSLIPMTQEVDGVTTQNLEYPLKNAKLFFGSRLIAISNVMLGDTASISIKSGWLYVIKSND